MGDRLPTMMHETEYKSFACSEYRKMLVAMAGFSDYRLLIPDTRVIARYIQLMSLRQLCQDEQDLK